MMVEYLVSGVIMQQKKHGIGYQDSGVLALVLFFFFFLTTSSIIGGKFLRN